MRIASEYSSDESPAHPALEVKLSDPSSGREKRIIAKVDTGFSGSLLVRLDDYLNLGLQLHEEPQKGIAGRVASGLTIPLRMSRAVLEIGAYKTQCDVYTTPLLLKPLLGRELLSRWRTMLDGPAGKMELEI